MGERGQPISRENNGPRCMTEHVYGMVDIGHENKNENHVSRVKSLKSPTFWRPVPLCIFERTLYIL